MKKCFILVLVAFILITKAKSQTENHIRAAAKEVNSQKTANSKDIFTSLFRATIDNLLGDDKSFTFNSSFFGIDSIFRRTGRELSYERERKLRQKSFNIGLTGDSINTIAKISGGFTFTLLNRKDITLTKFRAQDEIKLESMAQFMRTLNRAVLNFISTKRPTEFANDSINNEIRTSWRMADRKNDYSDLHPYIKEAINSKELTDSMVASNALSSIYSVNDIAEIMGAVVKGEDRFHKVYINIAEKYARKPLWTFSPTMTYDRVNKQGEYSFVSDFTVGIGKDISKKPWELEIKSLFKISNDTSLHKTNYENKPFLMSLGVNKVLMENGDKESKMEFKFFTQYDYQFGNVPVGKDAGIFTLNTTLRINVFKSLWLPLTLKYDPENSNFLGYFSITANLGD